MNARLAADLSVAGHCAGADNGDRLRPSRHMSRCRMVRPPTQGAEVAGGIGLVLCDVGLPDIPTGLSAKKHDESRAELLSAASAALSGS